MQCKISPATERNRKIEQSERDSWNASFELREQLLYIFCTRPLTQQEHLCDFKRRGEVEPSEVSEGTDITCPDIVKGIHRE